VIHLLLRNELVLADGGVAVEVDLIALQLSAVPGERCFGLAQLNGVGTRIDLRQYGSALDLLALAKGDAVQSAVDLRAHRHGLERGHGPEPVEIERHVAVFNLGHDDGCGPRTALVTFAFRTFCSAARREQDQRSAKRTSVSVSIRSNSHGEHGYCLPRAPSSAARADANV